MKTIPLMYVNVLIILLILLPSCTADSRENTDLYQHQNIRCIKCQPGEYVVNPCKTHLGYSECKKCEVGFYTYDGGAFDCDKCRDCKETYRQNIPDTCKSTQNTQCTCEDGKYWDTSFCKKCDPPKHIIRSGGDEADQCVYCDNGKYYNHSFPDNPCIECMKCDVGMSLVQQCNYTHDTICIPPTSTPTLKETDKTDIIIACSVVGFLAVLIIIIIILYRKRKILVTRPKWLQPTIEILTHRVGEVDRYLTGLPDVTNFNCAVKYHQIWQETRTSTGAFFSNFINQYYRADPVTVTAQVFYERLKDMQLNDIAEKMKNNQDINPFLNLITTDESASLLTGSESYLNGLDIDMADASRRTSGTSVIMCTEDHKLSNSNHRRNNDSVDAPRDLNQTNVEVRIKNKKDIDQTEVIEPLSEKKMVSL